MTSVAFIVSLRSIRALKLEEIYTVKFNSSAPYEVPNAD